MKTSLTLALLVLVVLVFAMWSALADEVAAGRAPGEASRKVMQRWVGDWSGGVAGASNVILPHIASAPDSAKVEWTLDNHFLQGTNLDENGKPVGVWMMRYNPSAKKYQVYFFTAGGQVSLWNGAWSEADQTMTWQARDSELGAAGSGHTRFVDDRQEWALRVTSDGETIENSGTLSRE